MNRQMDDLFENYLLSSEYDRFEGYLLSIVRDAYKAGFFEGLRAREIVSAQDEQLYEKP